MSAQFVSTKQFLVGGALSLLVLAGSAARAEAGSYGVSVLEYGGTSDSLGYSDSPDSDTWGVPAVGVWNDPSLAYSSSFALVSPTGAASSDATAIVTNADGNIGLHGTLFDSAAAPESGASSGFDIFAYDTFHISGSGGGLVPFAYTLTLHGSASLAGGITYYGSGSAGGLGLFENASLEGPWSVGTPEGCLVGCGQVSAIYVNALSQPNGYSVNGIIDLPAGSNVELGLYMWGRDYVDNNPFEGTDIVGAVDFGDTGFFTLTPLDPGTGFTTASGLTYASDPDAATVPEPSTALVLLVATAAMLGVGRTKAAK